MAAAHSVKVCNKCNATKPLEDFPKCKTTLDGRIGPCRECNNSYMRAYSKANRDRLREKCRLRAFLPKYKAAKATYMKTEAYKRTRNISGKKWIDENPQKHSAERLLRNEINSGRITRLPCEVCGATERIHGHHEDYSKPLEVMWLCQLHHSERHRFLGSFIRKKP